MDQPPDRREQGAGRCEPNWTHACRRISRLTRLSEPASKKAGPAAAQTAPKPGPFVRRDASCSFLSARPRGIIASASRLVGNSAHIEPTPPHLAHNATAASEGEDSRKQVRTITPFCGERKVDCMKE